MDREKLAVKYRKEGWSKTSIRKELNMSQKTLDKALEKERYKND